MATTASKLTGDRIREEAIDMAIPMYLLAEETKEGVLAKFKGDTIATIQFLRDRAFGVKPSPAVKEEPKKPAKAVKQPTPKVGTKQKSQASQNELF